MVRSKHSLGFVWMVTVMLQRLKAAMTMTTYLRMSGVALRFALSLSEDMELLPMFFSAYGAMCTSMCSAYFMVSSPKAVRKVIYLGIPEISFWNHSKFCRCDTWMLHLMLF